MLPQNKRLEQAENLQQGFGLQQGREFMVLLVFMDILLHDKEEAENTARSAKALVESHDCIDVCYQESFPC